MPFRTIVYSRHPSHRILREKLPRLPMRALIRLGSTSEPKDNLNRVEINSIASIKVSANKRLMKEAFDTAGVPTAFWTTATSADDLLSQMGGGEEDVRFPIVAKHIYGSRGTGNTLLNTKEELTKWAPGREFNKYIFENYASYLLEYRLHVTKDGCFYACRKALVKTTEASERWRRHIDNSVWLLETNPDFNKPNSWDDIVAACVKALKAIGADVLSFDVRVQNRMDKKGVARKYQYFILLECNSASSMQSPSNKEVSVCASKYLEVIPSLIKEKAAQ